MTAEEFSHIASEIEYRDWAILFGSLSTGFYLQVAFHADGDLQKGRKWFISQHSTRSEVVQTALKAVLTAEEHEAREKFRYRGESIFFPHLDVDEMVEQRRIAKEDRRAAVA